MKLRMTKLAILVVLSLSAFLLPISTSSSAGNSPMPPPAIQFTHVDIVVDPHGHTLAAYQLSLVLTTPNAQIVGIEGGDHAAFNAAPYYDPAAMQNHKIIVAAYSLNAAKDLPVGKTRVARLHIQLPANATPQFTSELTVAATTDGAAIPNATASLQPGENP